LPTQKITIRRRSRGQALVAGTTKLRNKLNSMVMREEVQMGLRTTKPRPHQMVLVNPNIVWQMLKLELAMETLRRSKLSSAKRASILTMARLPTVRATKTSMARSRSLPLQDTWEWVALVSSRTPWAQVQAEVLRRWPSQVAF